MRTNGTEIRPRAAFCTGEGGRTGAPPRPTTGRALMWTLLLALVLAAGFGFDADGASSQEACAPGYATDHVRVRMNPDASASALEAMKSANGEGAEYESRGLERLWIVDLPAGLSVPDALALYASLEGVVYTEPDHTIVPDAACEATGAGLGLALSDTPDPVRAGGTLLYEATVGNAGPEAAKNVEVTTGAPEGSAFLSAGFDNGGTRGVCETANDGVIRCRMGDLPAGRSANFWLKVRPIEAGVLSQFASVRADNALPGLEASASARTDVLPPRETRLGTCTILGTGGRDVLWGTPGRDVICGSGGGDILRGIGGDDAIFGGLGGDTLLGGSGSDELLGNVGSDILRARDGIAGNDVVLGGPGDDRVFADEGDDVATTD